MASYHLDVKSVQRSAGRSATASAAYRHAERIECDREGRVHDYRAKQGVEASFIVAPEDAPEWAHDRAALWNAAEARDTRVNSVTAREWEVALPHELDAAGRRALAEGFARELVARYRVAADVAIHAPHREGDKRRSAAPPMALLTGLRPATSGAARRAATRGRSARPAGTASGSGWGASPGERRPPATPRTGRSTSGWQACQRTGWASWTGKARSAASAARPSASGWRPCGTGRGPRQSAWHSRSVRSRGRACRLSGRNWSGRRGRSARAAPRPSASSSGACWTAPSRWRWSGRGSATGRDARARRTGSGRTRRSGRRPEYGSDNED